MPDTPPDRRTLADRASALLGMPVLGVHPLSGGDLSAVFRATLADGRALALKVGRDVETEAAMLRALRLAGAPTPEVVAVQGDLLALQRLEGSGSLRPAWADLAHHLRTLHAVADSATHTAPYGWTVDYAFGPVAIANARTEDWVRFWAENRLLCHLPHLPPSLARRVERLADGLADRLPRTPGVSLLHGDLWGGNVLAAGDRIVGLIDPACYYGDREVDLAMLTLFDHPPPAFLEALEPDAGWGERQPVYRLWPWLVHFRLFGDGYRGAVESTLAELGL